MFCAPATMTVTNMAKAMNILLKMAVWCTATKLQTSSFTALTSITGKNPSNTEAHTIPQNWVATSAILVVAVWKIMRNFASDEQSISCKSTDWEVHMLGQGLAAVTNATHGHTLAAVTDAYYRLLIDKSADAVARFKRLAVNVWNVNAEGKDDKAVAIEGLETMEAWMRSLGLAMTITECGGKEEDIEKYCDATFTTTTGYYTLTREDVAGIFRRSL